MEHSDYYSNYETSGSGQEFYENEYDYPSYSSNEIDYMYYDDLHRVPTYKSDYKATFPFKTKYFYPKSKRKHEKRYDSKTYKNIF